MKIVNKLQYNLLKLKKKCSVQSIETVEISDEEYAKYYEVESEPTDKPEELETYTITFKDEDQIVQRITGPTGTYVSVPNVKKEGYEFLGWSIDGINVTMPVDSIYDNNITYVAVWKKIEQEETYDYSGYDFGINGLCYNIISLEEKTVCLMCSLINDDIIIPNEIVYNNIEFKVTEMCPWDSGKYTTKYKITINKYIKPENLNTLGIQPSSYYFVNKDNPYMTAIDGILYSKDLKTLLCYPYAKQDENFTVSDYVEIINSLNNDHLKTIIMNHNVKNILHLSGDNIEYIKLSNNIKSIDLDWVLNDSNCPNIKNIILPKFLEEIYYVDWSKKISDSLENITIYNSDIINYQYNKHSSSGNITYNHGYIFRLSNLKEIHVIDENPVELKEGIFTDGKYFTLKVYVPQGCKTIYENTSGWNKFYNIIEIE